MLTGAERALNKKHAVGGSLIAADSAYAKTDDELVKRLGLTRKTLQAENPSV